jgi:hypothetical protein
VKGRFRGLEGRVRAWPLKLKLALVGFLVVAAGVGGLSWHTVEGLRRDFLAQIAAEQQTAAVAVARTLDDQHGKVVATVVAVCCAGGRGTTIPTTCARPPVTTARPATVAATAVFVCFASSHYLNAEQGIASMARSYKEVGHHPNGWVRHIPL